MSRALRAIVVPLFLCTLLTPALPIQAGDLTHLKIAKLVAANGAPGDSLGGAVAICGDVIVVGAVNADVGGNSDQGAAYVFERNHGGPDVWEEVTKITATGGAEYDFLAETVFIDGDIIAIFVDGFETGDTDRWSDTAP